MDGNGGKWGSYQNHRPDTLESLIQSAGMGLLAPVFANLPSFCLPALEWCDKMSLESSLPVGRGKLHRGMLKLRGTTVGPWHGMAEGILRLRVEGAALWHR